MNNQLRLQSKDIPEDAKPAAQHSSIAQ